MHPVTGVGGGAVTHTVTLGAAVAGSSASYVVPGANQRLTQATADLNVPADGWYAIGLTNSAGIAANSFLDFTGRIQVHSP